MNNTYLVHWGIKGQKWGIRRYQNEDGSYTTEGLSRYKRGKIYNKEHEKYKKEEYDKRIKNSKKYKEYENESDRLRKKYDIDRDGNLIDTSFNLHSKEDRERARQRLWENEENKSMLEDRFNNEASKAAGQRLMERYGKQAISDMNYRNNAVTANWLIGIGAFSVGVAVLARKK